MPYKKNKFKCPNCGNEVFRKETKLCMKCASEEKRKRPKKVKSEEQKLRIKQYKKEYFQKNKEKIKERNKNKVVDKDKRQHYYIKSRYGISKKEYEKMLNDKNFTCDICGYVQPKNAEKMQKLYIDHCHKTNQVRGLLCFSCNSALGHFKDNVEALKKAIKYLKKWQEN